MRKQYYIGFKREGREAVVFYLSRVPTFQDFGDEFGFFQGPNRTKRETIMYGHRMNCRVLDARGRVLPIQTL